VTTVLFCWRRADQLLLLFSSTKQFVFKDNQFLFNIPLYLFDVLLAEHLSIILATDQINVQILVF